MKVRYPVAGLFLILELPVLLAFAAGAAVAGVFSAIAVLCSRAAQVDVGVFLRGYGSHLRVRFDLRTARAAAKQHGPRQASLRDYGYRLRAAFGELGTEWVILALGFGAAVALGALIAD